MRIAHIFAGCMGSIRAAGNLAAWMQLIKKIKTRDLLDVPINSVAIVE